MNYKGFDLPRGFLYWIYKSGQGACTEYKNVNSSAEYGISREDFWNQYTKLAIKDIEEFLYKQSDEEIDSLLIKYRQSVRQNIADLQNHEKELTFLIEADENTFFKVNGLEFLAKI